MKNIEELYKMIDERDTWEYENPVEFDTYVNTLAGYFESEDDVEEFIKTRKYDYDYVYALSEAYEEVIEKFPSDRLEYLFEKFVLPSYPNGVPTAPPRYDVSLDKYTEL